MEITYLETTDRGPCPLVLVQDACTREIVGYGFFPSCGAMEAADVVDAAVLSRFPRTGRAEGLGSEPMEGPSSWPTDSKTGCGRWGSRSKRASSAVLIRTG